MATMSSTYNFTFTAGPEHIDQLGHVNNAVWVQWMEIIAVAHWERDARPEDVATFAWVVVRHEIDFHGNIQQGESVEAHTFISDGPKGARFVRNIQFRNSAGTIIVTAKTTWAMINAATGRLMRIPPEVAAPFLPPYPSTPSE
jgi:acyl-CoA thioester hydrolase